MLGYGTRFVPDPFCIGEIQLKLSPFHPCLAFGRSLIIHARISRAGFLSPVQIHRLSPRAFISSQDSIKSLPSNSRIPEVNRPDQCAGFGYLGSCDRSVTARGYRDPELEPRWLAAGFDRRQCREGFKCPGWRNTNVFRNDVMVPQRPDLRPEWWRFPETCGGAGTTGGLAVRQRLAWIYRDREAADGLNPGPGRRAAAMMRRNTHSMVFPCPCTAIRRVSAEGGRSAAVPPAPPAARVSFTWKDSARQPRIDPLRKPWE
jgi:hypothetical protein